MSLSTVPLKQTGGCLCGGVRYVVNGPLRGVIACHCSQCRRTSGHYAAMTNAPSEHLELKSSHTLVWYQSSATAERGFCSTCGSNLFWRQFDGDTTSIGDHRQGTARAIRTILNGLSARGISAVTVSELFGLTT